MTVWSVTLGGFVPKETFFKIADDKRERLLHEAAALFAECGFNKADVAELAARAGVSKGSIYNYFESKEDLYLYVCRDGMQRSRQAIYGELDSDWDIYQQISYIFNQGARFVSNHPEYLILYVNIASAGMERFSNQMSLEVEKYTADHFKRLILRDMEKGLVRRDVDVDVTAFTVNSMYIIFMTSLVSNHFKIRLKEYLEIEGELTGPVIETIIQRTTGMINNLLKPVADK